MNLNLNNKQVLVTGSSRGIGLSIAAAFAKEGASVILHGKTKSDHLFQCVKELRAKYYTVDCIWGDMSVASYPKILADNFGDIDILVNNAGEIPVGYFHELNEEQWNLAWQGKLQSYIRMTNEFANIMSNNNRGVICNIIGIGGIKPRPNYIYGGTANAALIAFTQAMGAHSHERGVRIFGVNPGRTNTDRIRMMLEKEALTKYDNIEYWDADLKDLPFQRLMRPEEVGDFVTFCCSPIASYLTGTCINLDGGHTFK